MVEVFNLEGMPVYKLRANEKDTFVVSDLEIVDLLINCSGNDLHGMIHFFLHQNKVH